MKKKVLIPLIPAVALLGLLAVQHRAAYVVLRNLTTPKYPMEEDAEWTGGRTWRHVPYAEGSGSQYLDLYVPEGESRPPLFVLIHGGAFLTGDSDTRQVRWMYRFFRDRGFACASVNYRLAGEAPFPAGLEDCRAAIRFLRAHQAEYGYDAGKIAVWGESAGGYLALMCAVVGEEDFSSVPFLGQEETGDVSARCDVLVDYYGAAEFGSMAQDWKEMGIPEVVYDIGNGWIPKDQLEGFENVESYWLRQNVSEASEEETARWDPYAYIRKHLTEESGPAVWITHGDCDITVPCAQSRRLYETLAGILGTDRVRFRQVPGAGHAGDVLYTDRELEAVLSFLEEQL